MRPCNLGVVTSAQRRGHGVAPLECRSGPAGLSGRLPERVVVLLSSVERCRVAEFCCAPMVCRAPPSAVEAGAPSRPLCLLLRAVPAVGRIGRGGPPPPQTRGVGCDENYESVFGRKKLKTRDPDEEPAEGAAAGVPPRQSHNQARWTRGHERTSRPGWPRRRSAWSRRLATRAGRSRARSGGCPPLLKEQPPRRARHAAEGGSRPARGDGPDSLRTAQRLTTAFSPALRPRCRAPLSCRVPSGAVEFCRAPPDCRALLRAIGSF